MSRKKIAALSLGCKVNDYDTRALLSAFLNKGYDIGDFNESADVYLINTCTITALSSKKSRQMIRRAKKNNPNAIVIASGCYSQTAPEEVAALDEVNIIVGTTNRANLADITENYRGNKPVSRVVSGYTKIFEELETNSTASKTRAFLKIQDGCDCFCTYCIIPYARGPARSRLKENILAEAQIIAERGHKEIVLTGIHISSYGKDFASGGLGNIINEINAVESVERIRLSSLEPGIISPGFLEEISYAHKLCPHFHLSLQSGSDKILRKMNRSYTTQDFREAVEALRRFNPDVGLTTDIIAGFPGETYDDFIATLDFVKEIGFSQCHIFPYSPKKGTPAHDFEGQIGAAVKKERAAILKDLAKTEQNKFITGFLGKTLKVLYEKRLNNGMYEGYSENYIKVQSAEGKENTITDTCITDIKEDIAFGAAFK